MSFRPGADWGDTEGHSIQAHGGGVLHHDNMYFWYGEHRSPDAEKATGISVYCSRDLVNWVYQGLALKRGHHSDTLPSNVLERPKVLHNRLSGKFVMWMHIDSANYSWAKVGVAVSDSPVGPFLYQRSFRPHGQESRDFTVWKDDDTQLAYLAYSSENNLTMHICNLTQDYRDVTSYYSRLFVDKQREAPCFFKSGDCFMLATSGCTGWSPNKLGLFWSRNPFEGWASLGNPCVGGSQEQNEKTFFAQPNFVMAVPGHTGAFVFMADRWDKDSLPQSRYVWLPFWVHDNMGCPQEAPVTGQLCWRDDWSLDNLDDYKADTRLITAAAHGKMQLVQQLLAARADADTKDHQGWTALMKAASAGHVNVAQLLITAGVDVNARDNSGSTALMHAAWAGQLAFVQYLLTVQADKDAKNNQGHTAAMTASDRGHAAVVDALRG